MLCGIGAGESVRRRFLLLATSAVLSVSCASESDDLSASVSSIEPNSGDASVEHRTFECDVSWDEGLLMVDDCDIRNVRYPSGEYSITLRGQIPEERLAAFRESGVTERDVTCWVNYLFIEGTRGGPDPIAPDPGPIVSEGTRYFTSDGMMTERCHFAPQD
jgi:hypothetical protein